MESAYPKGAVFGSVISAVTPTQHLTEGKGRGIRSMLRDLASLPKAHLHLHFDGALRASTLADLAGKAGIEAPLPSGYGSFDDFTATITAAAACLRTPGDVARVMEEIAEDAVAAGAVWIEVSVWPGLFAGRLGPHVEAVRVLVQAARAAEARHGAGVGLVLAANRGQGPDRAREIARLAADFVGEGVVGFGLDGDESRHPPAPFADACALARRAGLAVVPHAGELLGADSVAQAVDLLGARRVMHGVRCLEDPHLVARLAATGTVLDVCPTSNVLLSVAPSLREHPLPRLLAAGIRCTVNADDPLLFDSGLLTEYRRCREQMGLSDRTLAEVARTSLRASAAPGDLVEAAVRGIDRWLDGPAGA
ncbi:adenosine deaminase [Streptomyces celluloflavus]|uniref:adenosine deaminase n=1 Tax=Streptomyces celluloflavus TaxID=58344 RepID=UPI0036DC1291